MEIKYNSPIKRKNDFVIESFLEYKIQLKFSGFVDVTPTYNSNLVSYSMTEFSITVFKSHVRIPSFSACYSSENSTRLLSIPL